MGTYVQVYMSAPNKKPLHVLNGSQALAGAFFVFAFRHTHPSRAGGRRQLIW
jgi:hypothetical protein